MSDVRDKVVPASGQAVPTEYTLSLLPEDCPDWGSFSIRVQYRGEGRWAVVQSVWCLSAIDTWDHEPRPSARGDGWLSEHRFVLEDAIDRATRMLPRVRVNGVSARDIQTTNGHAS